MISFGDLLAVVFLAVFIYVAYWLQRAVSIYQHKNYSDFKSYQETIRKAATETPKPDRPRDRKGIHTVKSEHTKITTEQANGLRKTSDNFIPLSEADPSAVMEFIDNEMDPGSADG